MTAARCGSTIEGPVAHGSRRGIRTWRRSCKAFPMRPPVPPIDGFNPARCAQHQDPGVRYEVYRRAHSTA